MCSKSLCLLLKRDCHLKTICSKFLVSWQQRCNLRNGTETLNSCIGINFPNFPYCHYYFRVMENSSKNRMHSQNLAIVFGPTLLWPERDVENMTMTAIFQSQVIKFFLLECENIFPGL